MNSANRRFHPAWIVAATTFLVLICAAGVRATPGVLIVPLEAEFGWSRAVISAGITVNLVLYGLVGPFSAATMQRFGVRRTTMVALLLMLVGVAAASHVRYPWQLLVSWGVLVGIGSGNAAMVLGATIVSRWFHRHRGMVMGILTASTATGQLVFLPALAWLVEHRGWRSVTTLLVVALGVVFVLVVLLLRADHPRDIGLRPYGASPAEPEPPPVQGNPFVLAIEALRSAARKRDFWILAASFFVCGATTNGLVGTHLVPACHDHGIPEVRAAGLLAIMGVFDLVGTTTSGWLSDRFDARKLLFVYYGVRGLSLLYLPQAFGDEVFALPVFAVLYGLDWIATVPPTLKLTRDTVGERDAPTVFGWIVAGHQIGAGFGALSAGTLRTMFDTYTLAWLSAGGLCVATAVMVLFIGRGSAALAPSRAGQPVP
ncbi:putative membrane transport protein [Labilithrix luteola]|uniref:Putative membrane transport protein n=1 Tax=Labilithrix luteola TaxID=1391654 RepID=A0A0K1Q1C2_9BACT|nr:MFS transporter [Labilithrix luteola]AKU99590.1 putative membrane transport protein [Labilithrix luteola]